MNNITAIIKISIHALCEEGDQNLIGVPAV